MRLTELLSPEVIRIPLQNNRKDQIIAELVDLLYKAKKIKNFETVLAAVMERERVMSTAMGDGVAIPHAKTDAVDGLAAAFGITRNLVDFDSIDGTPVHIVFLLIGPTEQSGPHLKALSRISRLMHREEFRQRLAGASDGQEVLDIIQAEERKYFSF